MLLVWEKNALRYMQICIQINKQEVIVERNTQNFTWTVANSQNLTNWFKMQRLQGILKPSTRECLKWAAILISKGIEQEECDYMTPFYTKTFIGFSTNWIYQDTFTTSMWLLLICVFTVWLNPTSRHSNFKNNKDKNAVKHSL